MAGKRAVDGRNEVSSFHRSVWIPTRKFARTVAPVVRAPVNRTCMAILDVLTPWRLSGGCIVIASRIEVPAFIRKDTLGQGCVRTRGSSFRPVIPYDPTTVSFDFSARVRGGFHPASRHMHAFSLSSVLTRSSASSPTTRLFNSP